MDVTQLLMDWRNGNKAALDQMIPLVYQELRKLAAHHIRKEKRNHSLQPTGLIHEAYLRLIRQNLPDMKSRVHFFGVAAHLMREILVDHARKHRASKRGGNVTAISLDEAVVAPDHNLI